MYPITVVIADHGRPGRRECARLLHRARRIRVVGEAETGPEVVARAKLRPHVLLLDLDLYSDYGGVLLRVLRQASPGTRVILLTRDGAEASILTALSHGARG